MILLDTNIISELMKPQPSQKVINWIEAQNPWELFISSITVGEVTYGLAALPIGKRRKGLESLFQLAKESLKEKRRVCQICRLQA